MTPDYYAVAATIVTKSHEDRWVGSTQVPTFFLAANVQGILSTTHADEIARTILPKPGDTYQGKTVHKVFVTVNAA